MHTGNGNANDDLMIRPTGEDFERTWKGAKEKLVMEKDKSLGKRRKEEADEFCCCTAPFSAAYIPVLMPTWDYVRPSSKT